LGVGRRAKSFSLKKLAFYEVLRKISDLTGSCEHSDEHFDSIKGWEFLD